LIGECLVVSAPEISSFILTDSVNPTTFQTEDKQTLANKLVLIISV